MCIEKYAEVYNVEYAVVWWKVCRDVQCVHCRVYRHDAIPDGITLHLGMEILSLATRTAWTSEARHTRSSILTRYFGIPTGGPDTVVFWYFGHVFWYFGAARHENGLFLRHRPHLSGATSVGLHDLGGGVSPIPGNWFLIYSNRCLGKFKWLRCKRRRWTNEELHRRGSRNTSRRVGGGVGAAKLHSFPFKWCSDLYF